MKKVLASLAAFAAPVAALAQEGGNGGTVTVTPIVDPTTVQSSLITSLTPWLTVGLGIGISVFIVYLGWRLLKRFTR